MINKLRICFFKAIFLIEKPNMNIVLKLQKIMKSSHIIYLCYHLPLETFPETQQEVHMKLQKSFVVSYLKKIND